MHVGDTDVVQLLLDNGADVHARNRYGSTPLHRVASAGYKDVAELLLARGAEVNVMNNKGQTPLHKAAIAGKRMDD